MQVAVFFDKGAESLCSEYIKQLGFSVTAVFDQYCRVQITQIEDAFYLAYVAQCATRVIVITGIAKTPEETITSDLSLFLDANHSFRSSVYSTDETIDKEQLEKSQGALIKECIPESVVDLSNPNAIVWTICLEDHCLSGVDVTGVNLAKREYKIYNEPGSLRASIAFDLLLFSQIKKTDVVLDPFCGSGTICIEALLWFFKKSPHVYTYQTFACLHQKPFVREQIQQKITQYEQEQTDIGLVHGFDIQSKNIDFCKRNAKIAGVLKQAQFSRIETDFMDLKFEQQVDAIVTCPPVNKPKVYKQFFSRVQDVLKKKATITFCLKNPNDIQYIDESWKIIERLEVFMGKTPLLFIKMERK
ncbi:MAG: hypothetical protein ACMXYF_01865 [Candidatus Woesearchaeota archaeon]